MLFKKKRRHVALVYNDFMLKALASNSDDLSQARYFSVALDEGIVVEGIIEDEFAFFELLKVQVKSWGIKGYDARFYVPESTVMMKSIDHPSDLKDKSEIRAFVEMEIGRSIHLPFENPLIDLYDADENDGKATIFATNADEVRKITGLLDDAGLHPSVADIKVISLLRLVNEAIDGLIESTTLLIDWSINELSLAIYSGGEVEFLRFQTVETERAKWRTRMTEEGFDYVYEDDVMNYHAALMEPLAEIERIINFYRYSLNKGEKGVDRLLLTGDNPEIAYIADMLESQLNLPVDVFDDELMAKVTPDFHAQQAGLVSLALKEVPTA